MKLHENGARNSCGMCCTKIQHLNVHYGSSAVLSDINLHIHCGELTAIIGPNGAGKSTLLKAMLGVIPHDGSIIFTDVNGNQTSAPRIGYVPQFLELDRSMPVTVLDLFLIAGAHTSAWLGASKRARLEAREILASVNAAELLEHSIGSLSGGEMQRVLLALALLKKPDILLLDEPVSGVDQNGLALFYRAIDRIRAQYDLTTILISHDFNLVSTFADRVVLLDTRILAVGTPKSVFASDEFSYTFKKGGGDIAGDL